MNRKHNPWVALVALILLAVILVMACTGCSTATTEAEATETAPDRFIIERDEYHDESHFLVITDTETGAQYLLVGDYYGACGLTVLQPGEG